MTTSTIRRSTRRSDGVIKRIEPVWLALVVVGALNWGIVGLFDANLVDEIFGTGTVADVVYVIVGVAGR